MNLQDLDRVRDLLIDEIQADIDTGRIYISDRLTREGQAIYPTLLLEAARGGGVTALVNLLHRPGTFSRNETRRTPKGKITQVKVPANAVETLAEGEFNRYYMRAVCRYAKANGQDRVECYRAKLVSEPRWESQRKIGSTYSADALLADLRKHPTDTALGLPPGPNSGLSVRLQQPTGIPTGP